MAKVTALPAVSRGRGVVPETLPEFQVICRDGTLYADDLRGQFLFTHARATLIAGRTGGKMWRMTHTPYSEPQAYSPVQRQYFLARRCPYLLVPGHSRRQAVLCGKPMAVRTERGYCADHKGKLLPAGFPPSCGRAATGVQLLACFRGSGLSR
jgi:hypothetical protein